MMTINRQYQDVQNSPDFRVEFSRLFADHLRPVVHNLCR